MIDYFGVLKCSGIEF